MINHNNSAVYDFSLCYVAELMKDLSSQVKDNDTEFITEFSDLVIQIKSILDAETVVEVNIA